MNGWSDRKSRRARRIGVAAVCILCVLFTGCLGWILEKPTIVVREISLTPRSLLEMELRLGIEVHNPNRFDLTLTALDYTLSLDDRKIGEGRLEQALRIPAASTTSIRAPLSVRFGDLGGGVRALLTGGEIPYRIEGSAVIKTVFGSDTFPFTKDGHL
ncbi:MAG TPA: LEA type 2 family protein [Syntrophales bacterium]|nr:LEA type 2 family protein [Syntrophales bacterium]